MDFLFNDNRTVEQKKLDLSLSRSLQIMKKNRIDLKEKNKRYKCVLCHYSFSGEKMKSPEWYKNKFAKVCFSCYERISKKNHI